MESRENKIIKDKIDSLQQLPVGYTPNLASKWDIIEAGLPAEKSKVIPLVMRWSVAAALIVALFFTATRMNQHTAPEVGLGLSANTPLNIIDIQVEKKQTTMPAKQDVAKNSQHTKTKVALPEPQVNLIVKQQSQEPIKNEISKDLIFENSDSASTLNNEVATIIPQQEIPKRAKRRTYQKDFNDGQLVMDTAYTKPASQQFSFKLQLHKSIEDGNQPVHRLQLKQVL